MAWPMPTAGQWNSGLAIAPDMTMANMGSYTAEQWAALQHQNWQQWAQWQQQYAQWQNQYGDKYSEQMQAIQSMGGLPPLPPATAAPPPAPPPPDQPPPPPHENNQPLYGHTQTQAAPVTTQPANQHRNNNSGNLTNVNTHPQAGNNTNWPYAQESAKPSQSAPPAQSSVNAEALKKLAEEERLFDIQFQKWEQEIEKWKKENVNHPDKQAYKEYEQKFETCRNQLMERRQQMKQKRARLLNNPPPPPQSSTSTPTSNVPTTAPPNLNNMNKNNFSNKRTQNYASNLGQSYADGNNSQYQQQQYNMPKGAYNRNNNKNIDPQDRYESYQNMSDNTYASNDNFSPMDPSFLPTSSLNKGIPGLDLVPEADKTYVANNKQDVIDITQDQPGNQMQSKGPDYTTISKGINNILGDEKIMNILSMVHKSAQDQTILQPANTVNVNPDNYNMKNNMNTNAHFGQGNRAQDYNNQHFNRQGTNNYPVQQSQEINYKYPPQNRGNDVMTQEQFNYDHNDQYSSNNLGPQYDNGSARPGPLIRPNVPPSRAPIRPLMQEIIPSHVNVNEFSRAPHDRQPLLENNINPVPKQPIRPQWIDEPMFTPSLIVEYEHKPLRLKARDFIEPVHMFDYNHISKDGEVKKKDFEREADELFSRKSRRPDKEIDYSGHRYSADYYSRDYERRAPREELRDDYRPRLPPRDDYDDRRRPEFRHDDRRRDDRDKYSRRDDLHRDRERDLHRERDRVHRREDIGHRGRSHERDARKRGLSRDSDVSNNSLSKKPRDKADTRSHAPGNHIVMIDDLLESPGRSMRPEKIVIILRGPPGSGKSYLAKLIRDREAEYGGTVRIMSIDDYFMQEGEVEERDPVTGKMVKKPTLKYEYDPSNEESYLNSLKRAFKRSLNDGYFTFLIYDAVNDQARYYADVWNHARQLGFQVYVCTMELDSQVCFKRNIHNRKLEDIEVICTSFCKTPSHHIQLDATTLLQSAAITEVQMEDANDEVVMEDAQEPEVESVFSSKWEKMDDAAQLARLDGTSKPLRPSQLSMEDYLQLDDWKPSKATPGKKSVKDLG
ncbi:YLP motif-containing protein 1-like isoform X2 [Trichoplusia ni]|uniref:YLP motif-containing protein 1 n=1 Tax=Trichoplusia ni TaxID=7111 RepID=A0A7E5VPC2_TRINI|nr:YLP motif-containing protein 1-like isoform X2 [Trichoplusia ni]